MILFLYAFWIILNQNITLEIALVGVVIVAAVFIFMCVSMGYSLKLELAVYKLIPLGLVYALILTWEIIKSNVAVARLVLTHGKNNKPYIVHVKIPLESRLTRTVYANSITLTPGTITVDEKDGVYTVYCLDKPMAEGIDETALCKILMKMEAILK